MYECLFEMRHYSQERLWALRWYLFELPQIRSVRHVEENVIAIAFDDGLPRVAEWLTFARARGYELRPIVGHDDVASAA
jgi:hypothetical protein